MEEIKTELADEIAGIPPSSTMSAFDGMDHTQTANVVDLCGLDLQSLYNLSQTCHLLRAAANRVQELSAHPAAIQLTVTRSSMGQLEILDPESDNCFKQHPQLLHLTQPWLITQDAAFICWILRHSRRIKCLSLIDPNVSLIRQGSQNLGHGAEIIRSVAALNNYTCVTNITLSVRVTNSQPYLCQLISKCCRARMSLTLTGSATTRDQRALGKILSHLSWVKQLHKLKLDFDRLDVKTLVMVHLATKGKPVTNLTLLKRFTDSTLHSRCNIADRLSQIINNLHPGSLQHLCLGKHKSPPMAYVNFAQKLTPSATNNLGEMVLLIDQRVSYKQEQDAAKNLWMVLAAAGGKLNDVHVDRFIGTVSMSDFIELINAWLTLLDEVRPEITIRNISICRLPSDQQIDQIGQHWPQMTCKLKGTVGAYWGLTLTQPFEMHPRLNVDFVMSNG